jgi:hypothetical protein
MQFGENRANRKLRYFNPFEFFDPTGLTTSLAAPGLCSEVADGVTQNNVSLFREPDAVTPPVRFDKRGCGNVAR